MQFLYFKLIFLHFGVCCTLAWPHFFTFYTEEHNNYPVGERLSYCKDATKTGACVHESFCNYENGENIGTCENGLVCCNILKNCGSQSSAHQLTFQNPSFPKNDTDDVLCPITLRISPDICAIRMDNEVFEMQKSVYGACVLDAFTMLGVNISTNLCGNLTNYRKTIDVEGLKEISLAFILPGNEGYKFSIEISMMQCNSFLPLMFPLKSGIRNINKNNTIRSSRHLKRFLYGYHYNVNRLGDSSEESFSQEPRSSSIESGEIVHFFEPSWMKSEIKGNVIDTLLQNPSNDPSATESTTPHQSTSSESSTSESPSTPDGATSNATSTSDTTTDVPIITEHDTLPPIAENTTDSFWDVLLPIAATTEKIALSSDISTGGGCRPRNLKQDQLVLQSSDEKHLRLSHFEQVFNKKVKEKNQDAIFGGNSNKQPISAKDCWIYDPTRGVHDFRTACQQQGYDFRIVGGDFASVNEFPWMVGIARGSKFVCGGSLITHRHVLSAAHCYFSLRGTIEDLTAIVGDHDLTDPLDVKNFVVGIKKIITHLSFDPMALENDIAILELCEPVMFSKSISPIRIPAQNDLTFENENGTVSGWGRFDVWSDDFSPKLKKHTTTIINNTVCKEKWIEEAVVKEEMHLCLDLKGGTPCHGDSGGPLVVCRGIYCTLVGLVSYGNPFCTNVGLPVVFTRLSSYIDWITMNISPIYYEELD